MFQNVTLRDTFLAFLENMTSQIFLCASDPTKLVPHTPLDLKPPPPKLQFRDTVSVSALVSYILGPFNNDIAHILAYIDSLPPPCDTLS